MVTSVKCTDFNIRFKIYDNFQTRNPVNLSQYVDFICTITENGRLLIEKKYGTNDMTVIHDTIVDYPYIVNVMFKKEDTENISINPPDEEKRRLLELFGIDNNGKVKRLVACDFYLEGSGYYVRNYRN